MTASPYTDLETSKRLRAAGFPQHTNGMVWWRWATFPVNSESGRWRGDDPGTFRGNRLYENKGVEWYAAPDLIEVLEWFEQEKGWRLIWDSGAEFIQWRAYRESQWLIRVEADTPAALVGKILDAMEAKG